MVSLALLHSRVELAVIRAQVSGLPVTPRRARPISTLTVSLRGLERPLGQALASSCRQPRGDSSGETSAGTLQIRENH
jgi:hypothetical protein